MENAMQQNQVKTLGLEGQHAVVFGGSGGIGKAVVKELAAHGVGAVSFTYGRNKITADELRKEIEGLGVKCYIASPARLEQSEIETFLEASALAVGEEITMMVDTVGVSPDTDFPDQTAEIWQNVYGVNVTGSFLALRATADRMKEKGIKGSIVLITSTNGINSYAPFSGPYDAAKAAQALMMRSNAEKYAKEAGIRINAVAPGWVDTKMNDTVPPDEMKKELEKIWIKRQAEPKEIASIIAFLLSSESSFIFGQNLMVDGGY